MVQAGLGGTPTLDQPLLTLRARGGTKAVEHVQGRIRCPAAEQGIGIHQHHREGLGRRSHRQQPLLQQAQAGHKVKTGGLLAGQVQGP